jgi:hypothetical protein
VCRYAGVRARPKGKKEAKGEKRERVGPRELTRCAGRLPAFGHLSFEEDISMTISTFKTRVLGKGLLTSVGIMLVLSVTLIGATVVLAAPPAVAVNLDQCRNGGLAVPQTFVQCTGTGSGSSGWVNGNAGASNAHYAEGESISYRARLTGLHNNDVVTLIMGYDVIHNGHDALDFLTDKNRWQPPETTVGATPDLPCDGVSGCSGTPATIDITTPPTNIHVDPSKTLANGCQSTSGSAALQPTTAYNAVNGAGQEKIELFGGTPAATNPFLYVGPAPSLLDTNGDQEQQVQVTFTANQANVVLAWGAHIASRLDWGCSGSIRSASGISGSPYHMRIKSAVVNSTPLSLGNQDRSLSANAVIFFTPGITTTLSATSVSIGTAVHDSATLTNATSTAGGTVTYSAYAGANTCSGTDLLNSTVTVTNGVVPNSADFTPTSAGTYSFQAVYSGDNNNAAATSDCTTEQLVVNPNGPTLITSLSASSILNTATLTDSATLSGSANDTSRITISAYSGTGSGACTGTPVESHTETGTTNGDRTYGPVTFGPLAAGHYEFQATIPADNNNTAASSTCGDEALTVKNGPTASTAQTLLPNDSFTLSGFAGSPSGTVDFYLFPPSVTCSVANETNAAVLHFTGSLSGGSASTSNTTTTVTAEGQYFWIATWGGDSLNNAASSTCKESFTLDNDVTAP